jgi:hypothetical protein
MISCGVAQARFSQRGMESEMHGRQGCSAWASKKWPRAWKKRAMVVEGGDYSRRGKKGPPPWRGECISHLPGAPALPCRSCRRADRGDPPARSPTPHASLPALPCSDVSRDCGRVDCGYVRTVWSACFGVRSCVCERMRVIGWECGGVVFVAGASE